MKTNPAFILRKICDLYLLIPRRKNEITMQTIALNNTAAIIFLHCKEANNPEELALIVSKYFNDISQEDVSNCLVPYIRELIQDGFLIQEDE